MTALAKTLEFKGKSFQISYVDSYATHPTWYSYEDEQDVRERFWNPGKGDIVLDIGACVGSYTLPALAHGACVYAWAPGRLQEGTLETELLFYSVRLNEGFRNRLIAFPTGLYSEAGYLNTNTLEFSQEYQPFPWIYVQSLDVMGFHPSWMKLDVEGVELEVLKGAEQTIRRSRPKILTECHHNVDPSIAYEVDLFLTGQIGGYKLVDSIKHPASNVVHTFHVPV